MSSSDPVIIFEDSYGVWTEDDQISAAAEVFAMLDREEECSQQS